ncbi:17234_t:CDS:2, partial [Dentiscutata erythropus]
PPLSIITSTKQNIPPSSIITQNPTKQQHLYLITMITPNLTINDFNIIKNLNKRNFGSIKLAQHKITNKICAIKAINREMIYEQKIIENVTVE